MIALIIETLTDLVNSFGYLGIFIATSLEYGCFPVSSEVLLPFIGYSVYKGEMSLLGAVIVSTAGGIVGSLFCYCFGRFGKTFIEKSLCKRFSSIKKGIHNAERVFDKYGKQSVLLARVFPIARTYISIPAGLAGMNVAVFILYTSAGALIWNTVLISAGFYLGEYWGNASMVMADKHIVFYIITAILSIILLKLSKREQIKKKL